MIAVFGGSFNPIHNGHLGLAGWIVRNGYADRVWLMVSPQNPLKPSPGLADERLRLRWAQMACKGTDGVSASDFEFSLPRPSYTWNTLKELGRKYPHEKFSLVIGADNWKCFDRWARHEWILQHFPILIYPREGVETGQNLPANVSLMPAPLFPVSSTQIRDLIQAGGDPSPLLPEAVYQDILRQKAYLR